MKLNVKDYVSERKEMLKEKIRSTFRSDEKLKLIVLSNTSDERTLAYMRNKVKVGAELGIEVKVIDLKDNSQLRRIMMQNAGEVPTILQLPCKDNQMEKVYQKLNEQYKTDIDGFFHYENIYKGKLWDIIPATPKGIMIFIAHQKMGKQIRVDKYDNLIGNVVIFGRGELIGKPLSILMLKHCKSLQVMTSSSTEEERIQTFKNADTIILATGKDNYLNEKYIEGNTKSKLIIDTGIFMGDNGKLHGELYPILPFIENDENIKYTPVPSGVGLLTTWSLFENVYDFYFNKLKGE